MKSRKAIAVLHILENGLMKEHRLIEYDIVRSAGTLWIVGYWHFSAYVGFGVNEAITDYFTECIMATFFFISGLLLNGHIAVRNKQDLTNFVRKKVFHFFIPFLISAITLIPFNWYTTGIQLLLTITGISAFRSPMVMTLWFSSMLLLFYYYGLGFLLFNNNFRKYINTFLIISCAVLLVLDVDLANIDIRLIRYAPIYLVALLMKPDWARGIGRDRRRALLLISSTIFILCYFTNSSVLKRTIGYLSFVIFLVLASVLLSELNTFKTSKLFNSIINELALASSFAYFFHRQFYIVTRAIYSRILGERYFNVAFAYLIVLPLFLLLCNRLTRLYNTLLKERFLLHRNHK